jgi:hypothetical protein
MGWAMSCWLLLLPRSGWVDVNILGSVGDAAAALQTPTNAAQTGIVHACRVRLGTCCRRSFGSDWQQQQSLGSDWQQQQSLGSDWQQQQSLGSD